MHAPRLTGPPLTGTERFFQPDDIIVTKTDTGGKITYANDIFLRISGLTEAAALGRPHNIIRHPDMPAGIFRLLWETVKRGEEIFAYVLNRATNGDHYWVFAHVTPTLDEAGRVAGYHSNRRVPDRAVLTGQIMPLYRRMAEAERAAGGKAAGMNASLDILTQTLKGKDLDYDRFIFSAQA